MNYNYNKLILITITLYIISISLLIFILSEYISNIRCLIILALECGVGMTYKPQYTPCYATCGEPDAPEQCGLPNIEVCACTNPLDVLINGECVSAQNCGCMQDGVFHEVRCYSCSAYCKICSGFDSYSII